MLLDIESHPAWVCGLKPQSLFQSLRECPSHPAWVCGLKPVITRNRAHIISHTLRGCVD